MAIAAVATSATNQSVVAHDDDAGARGGQAADQARQVALAASVHAARRLVEHDEVGAHRGDRGDRKPLALAARQVARMLGRGPLELEPLQLGRRRGRGEPPAGTPRFLRPYSTSSSAVSWSR